MTYHIMNSDLVDIGTFLFAPCRPITNLIVSELLGHRPQAPTLTARQNRLRAGPNHRPL